MQLYINANANYDINIILILYYRFTILNHTERNNNYKNKRRTYQLVRSVELIIYQDLVTVSFFFILLSIYFFFFTHSIAVTMILAMFFFYIY